MSKGLSQAMLDVLAERRRQIEVEGWTPEHDDGHGAGEMACAAACYAVGLRLISVETCRGVALTDRETGYPVVRQIWPWSLHWWKPKDRRRDLVRAGALILAEIEWLDRAERRVAPVSRIGLRDFASRLLTLFEKAK